MHCWARYLLYLIVSVLALGQMLTACGQKGDLYLPEQGKGTEAAPLPGPDSSDEGLEALDDVPVAPPGPDTF